MKTFRIPFEISVLVTVDETKFDETFMAEFRQTMYPFHTLQEHVEHLAQLEARSLITDFVEGYGPREELGIETEVDNRHHFEQTDDAKEVETSALHVSMIGLRRKVAADRTSASPALAGCASNLPVILEVSEIGERIALTCQWPDGTETLEEVSEEAAALLGFAWDGAGTHPKQSAGTSIG